MQKDPQLRNADPLKTDQCAKIFAQVHIYIERERKRECDDSAGSLKLRRNQRAKRRSGFPCDRDDCMEKRYP